MRACRLAIVMLAFGFIVPRTFACSCSNGLPIQKSSNRYASPDRTVFTARVVALIGRIYIEDGRRLSSQAMAIVHESYWGLPWYWPKIILLDGSYPCDMAMLENEEYLVAGRKERYGVVAVNGCSRTQPLKAAQVDLKTLDGSHCSAPGGTILGHVRGEWDGDNRKYKTAKVESITFMELSGKTHSTDVDADGIYELRHLAGLFAPNSRIDENRYLALGWTYSHPSIPSVYEGVCDELDLTVRDYQITGQLLPGIGPSVNVELTDVHSLAKPIRADSIEPDGRFYFHKIKPGEYVLSVVANIGGANRSVFYPGVTDRAKATRVVINERERGRSYDFEARVLPVVPIPLALDPVTNSDKYLWDFQLLEGSSVVATRRVEGTSTGLLYGMRDAMYQLQLNGYPRTPLEDNYCQTARMSLTANSDMAPVHITAQCASKNR